MPGDVDFRRIPAILGNMLEHPCHSLGRILYICRTQCLRRKPVIDIHHGESLRTELVQKGLGPSFQTAAKNTAIFSILAVPLAVVLSLGLALILECRIPCKSWFRTFFLSPMMVPVASVVLIWQVVFHRNGTLNAMLAPFGWQPVDWLNAPGWCMMVIIILFLWKNLGYNMILFMAALNNIPKELLEVADVEGASAAHKFFNIKLRYLSPTVLFVTILSIINSFKVFREIYLLTGNYPYEGLYMLQHFMNNTFAQTDYQKMSTAAVLLAIVMVALIALLFKVEDAFGKDVEG